MITICLFISNIYIHYRKATASEITCLTSKATNPVSTSTVRVTFDGTEKVLRGASYQYVNNPNITDIYPTASFTRYVHGVKFNKVIGLVDCALVSTYQWPMHI